jgi:uncharacterized RDD family membrane protein YckC
MTGGAQPDWKRELNDKIAAARARRQAGQQHPAESADRVEADSDSRASRVAAAVAARYAHAPSYSEYLASQVRAAMMAAVAEQAAINQARHQTPVAASPADTAAETAVAEVRALPAPAASSVPAAGADREFIDEASTAKPVVAARHIERNAEAASPAYKPAAHYFSDPVEEALINPATPLPAKLLEFPRELIAARKARPRIAEGPLRESAVDEPGQLRIFEVDPAAISTKAEPTPQATEWSSIRLDAYPAKFDDHAHTAIKSGRNSAAYSQRPEHTQTHPAGRIVSQTAQLDMLAHVAGIGDRLMAGIVDAALVGIAFTLFVFAFAASTAHPPTGRPALIGGAFVFVFFYLLYQLLFFTYAEGTPGMRYARIALCTFDDDNPTREAMRKRIFALVLAAAPLGLGFLYVFFDEDHLGWHDRMTRMYQRSYK